MYYPDYMLDLAAAIARDRGEAGEHRRAGAATTAGGHSRDGTPHLLAPPALVGVTILPIFYAVLALHLGSVGALWILGLTIGLWIVGAAAVVGLHALAGRKAKGVG